MDKINDDEWTQILKNAEQAAVNRIAVPKRPKKKRKQRTKQPTLFEAFDIPPFKVKALPEPEKADMPPDSAVDEFKTRFMSISVDEVERIASLPQHLVNDDANPEWLLSRRHRLTGSISGAIAGYNKHQSPEDALEQLLRPSFTGNVCTRYGTKNEHNAEKAFIFYFDKYVVNVPDAVLKGDTVVKYTLETPGLCVSSEYPMCGMSPDGVLRVSFKSGLHMSILVEYKCPYSQRNRRTTIGVDDDTCLYPVSTVGKTTIPCQPYYTTQIMYGMGLLKMPLCFFVVWTPARNYETSILSTCSGGGNSVIAATPAGLIQLTLVEFDCDFYTDELFPTLMQFWHDLYVPDAVRLELGMKVPYRGKKQKRKRKRTWFGPCDVPDREELFDEPLDVNRNPFTDR